MVPQLQYSPMLVPCNEHNSVTETCTAERSCACHYITMPYDKYSTEADSRDERLNVKLDAEFTEILR